MTIPSAHSRGVRLAGEDGVYPRFMTEESIKGAGVIEAAVSEIGERFGAMRLGDPVSKALMVKSIEKYGQLSPVVVGPREDSKYELVDGFKRLHACRELGHEVLKARVLHAGRRGLKAAVIQLNWAHKSIGDLEEALVLQSLYREDGLRQDEIGVLLGRHKSWVSRRISLIERLCEEVIEHIRLGLCSASIGRELARLPRGNQEAALSTILKYRFNYRETVRLVSLLLSRPRWDQESILRFPAQILEDRDPPRPNQTQFPQVTVDIKERLMAMKKQAGIVTNTLDPDLLEMLTPKQRREILSMIEEVEQTLVELRKRLAEKDHDPALC